MFAFARDFRFMVNLKIYHKSQLNYFSVICLQQNSEIWCNVMIWNSYSIDWGHKQYGNWISTRGKWTFPLMKHSPKIKILWRTLESTCLKTNSQIPHLRSPTSANSHPKFKFLKIYLILPSSWSLASICYQAHLVPYPTSFSHSFSLLHFTGPVQASVFFNHPVNNHRELTKC